MKFCIANSKHLQDIGFKLSKIRKAKKAKKIDGEDVIYAIVDFTALKNKKNMTEDELLNNPDFQIYEHDDPELIELLNSIDWK